MTFLWTTHAAGRGAALAGGSEAAPDRAVDRKIEVGVVHHHDDVLAAHLEMDVLEGRRARFGHGLSDFGRSRK